MSMKVIQRRASMNGNRKNRLKVCKKDCEVETILEFNCKSDLGLSKDVGTSIGSQWEFRTTATPKQKSKRIRHGKGPARMPKREKFSSRRIAHEAKLLDHAKAKKERLVQSKKVHYRSRKEVSETKGRTPVQYMDSILDSNFRRLMRSLMKVQATANNLMKEEAEIRRELARERRSKGYQKAMDYHDCHHNHFSTMRDKKKMKQPQRMPAKTRGKERHRDKFGPVTKNRNVRGQQKVNDKRIRRERF